MRGPAGAPLAPPLDAVHPEVLHIVLIVILLGGAWVVVAYSSNKKQTMGQ